MVGIVVAVVHLAVGGEGCLRFGEVHVGAWGGGGGFERARDLVEFASDLVGVQMTPPVCVDGKQIVRMHFTSLKTNNEHMQVGSESRIGVLSSPSPSLQLSCDVDFKAQGDIPPSAHSLLVVLL